MFDDGGGEVDGGDVFVAFGVHLGDEGGVAAADVQDAVVVGDAAGDQVPQGRVVLVEVEGRGVSGWGEGYLV